MHENAAAGLCHDNRASMYEILRDREGKLVLQFAMPGHWVGGQSRTALIIMIYCLYYYVYMYFPI